MNHAAPGALRRRLIAAGSLAAAAALAFTGCAVGRSGDAGATDGGETRSASRSSSRPRTNPFFVAMQEGAEAAADDLGVELTLAAGKEDGDEDTQIQAIENAISKGDAGILITPNGPAVEDALVKARDAGLFVIALDTPPADPESVDITFATDNFLAGQEIGKWTAAKLGGEKATIALIDLFDDKVVSVDYNRDQGFLDGMGIDIGRRDQERRRGGDRHVQRRRATRSSATRRPQGAEDGGRTADGDPALEEPRHQRRLHDQRAGRVRRLRGVRGRRQPPTTYRRVGRRRLRRRRRGRRTGIIGATSQQYPVKMAELGVQAIFDLVETGETPENSEGLDFFNTGVALVTDEPAGRRRVHRHRRGQRDLLGLSTRTAP